MSQVINNPGIYTISATDYHADPCSQPSLSASIAQILLTHSPRHAALAHPRLSLNYQPDEDSRFDLGSAAHAMLLEDDRKRVRIVDAPDWRTRTARAERDEARINKQIPILKKHYDDVCAMVRTAHEFIETTELAGIFQRGKPEQTLVWTETALPAGHEYKTLDAPKSQPQTIWCRARLDWLTNDQKIILDYKTTESAQPDQFIRQIGRMGYDLQAEFYCRGIGYALKQPLPAFCFLAQEISPPYACSLVSLGNAYREIAARKVADALSRWQQCIQLGNWPGYSTQIHYAEPAAWQLAEIEAQLRQENW